MSLFCFSLPLMNSIIISIKILILICTVILVFEIVINNGEEKHLKQHQNSLRHKNSNSTIATTVASAKYFSKNSNSDLFFKKITDNNSNDNYVKNNIKKTILTTTNSSIVNATRLTTSTTLSEPITYQHSGSSSNNKEHSSSSNEKVEVVAFCNDPGKPPKSQISPVQLTYMEDEQVIYSCDQFISLKQYRKCLRGKWHGDTPLCGKAFHDNDLVQVLIYKAENGFPTRLLSEYNLMNQLQPFNKFGNSFIAERYSHPVRAENSTDYYWNLILARPALIQMVRLSFSIVNHLSDPKLSNNRFDVVSVATNQHRECIRVANNSVSPWHYNSTRFDYWYFCRAKSSEDFLKEISQMTNVVRVETTSEITIKYDLATFILAEQYSNNGNFSEPICGSPEIPVGLEARVINDQTNYVFTCSKDFQRIDNYGGQFQTLHCGYDNRWHGQLPQCYPTRQCQKFQLEDDATHIYLVEVYKYDRVFYFNQTEWIPVRGSRAWFRCKDETNIFVGKEVRICDDGEWTNSLPNCLLTSSVKSEDSLRTSSILIIVLTTLIFTFLLSSCSIYFFLKLRNQQSKNHHGGLIPLSEMELPNSSDYYETPGKQTDEIYESVDTQYLSYHDIHPNIPILDRHKHAMDQLYEHMDSGIISSSSKPVMIDTNSNYYDDSNVCPYLLMNHKDNH